MQGPVLPVECYAPPAADSFFVDSRKRQQCHLILHTIHALQSPHACPITGSKCAWAETPRMNTTMHTRRTIRPRTDPMAKHFLDKKSLALGVDLSFVFGVFWPGDARGCQAILVIPVSEVPAAWVRTQMPALISSRLFFFLGPGPCCPRKRGKSQTGLSDTNKSQITAVKMFQIFLEMSLFPLLQPCVQAVRAVMSKP